MTSTIEIPAGLVLTPRRLEGVAKPVWDVVHRDSQLPVIKDCESRDEAQRVAAAISGVDWTRTADQLRHDHVAKAVYLAVQHDVWHTLRRTKR